MKIDENTVLTDDNTQHYLAFLFRNKHRLEVRIRIQDLPKIDKDLNELAEAGVIMRVPDDSKDIPYVWIYGGFTSSISPK